ncbi:MAG: thiamine-phosphate pyrophosphorylase [Elusimicrobia bacterium]|nr:thiamine-phosphate pyrophosphorylase [Elusimicrobiota bacterium]
MKREKVPEQYLRVLDANLNRCREGLRVLEDTARFVWQKESYFFQFRGQRHSLDRMTRKFLPQLISSRASQSDRGRTVKEGNRKKIKDLVCANFRRCEESLRVLEEYGKLLSKKSSPKFKEIRYRIYDLEKDVYHLHDLKEPS